MSEASNASGNLPDMNSAARGYAESGLPVFPLHSVQHGRCSCGEPECGSPGKHPRTQHGFKEATTDLAQIQKWWTKWPDANIGMATGKASGLLVVDVDPRSGGDKSLESLIQEHGAFPTTARQKTGGGGLHFVFQHPGGQVPKELAKGIDLKGEGGCIVVAPSIHASGNRYEWEGGIESLTSPAEAPAWMLKFLEAPKQSSARTAETAAKFAVGERNDALASLGGSMRRRGMSQEAIEAALLVENGTRCEPPLPDAEVKSIAASVASYAPSEADLATATGDAPQVDWPNRLEPEAFHGIVGEIVREIEPHTESDPAALLIQILVAIGSIIGRGAHFCAEATKHFPNLFVMLVGQTAKGRKGSALGWVLHILEDVDADWRSKCVKNGLTSGEGLIYHVRDAIKQMVGQGKNRKMEKVDDGIDDKRLLIIEEEFANVLHATERQSNTLSGTLRQAWDSHNLQTLGKTYPVQATEPHISIIGHITDEELRKLLSSTATSNGFANRFLWACTERSKYLPEGGQVDANRLKQLSTRLTNLIAAAGTTQSMKRNAEARAIWHAVYCHLSGGRSGTFGKVTSRAEAQTMRVACVYAILDGSFAIRAEHMMAALAVWEYCENSAKYIFDGALPDQLADKILAELRKRVNGMSRNDIHNYLSRNTPATSVRNALATLQSMGLAKSEKLSGTKGRPTEQWYSAAENAANAVTGDATVDSALTACGVVSYLAKARKALADFRAANPHGVPDPEPGPPISTTPIAAVAPGCLPGQASACEIELQLVEVPNIRAVGAGSAIQMPSPTMPKNGGVDPDEFDV